MASHLDLPAIHAATITDLAAAMSDIVAIPPATRRNAFVSATAAWLEGAGNAIGDGRFAAAARALRGKQGGRPSIDDEDALEEMHFLIGAGLETTPEGAARSVAATLPGQWSTESAARRLAKKYRCARNP